MLCAAADSSREFSLSFLQPERILHSVESIALFSNHLPADRKHLRLWSALRSLQHPDLPIDDTETAAVWYDGPEDIFANAVGALIGGVPAREAAIPYPPTLRSDLREAFGGALTRFATAFPGTFAIFNRTIRYIIFARRAGYSGGTVSSRIGLIWLAPEPSWTTEMWIENLIHEFVHNALFIEDMVHCVLVAGADRLDQPDAQAVSAIRQVIRGYDKSYHSAFVSFTIIEMYRAIGRPDLADPFVAPLMICLEDLVARLDFATPHGQNLLIELVTAALSVYSDQLAVSSGRMKAFT